MANLLKRSRFITLTGAAFTAEKQSQGIQLPLRETVVSTLATLIATGLTDNIDFAPIILGINIGLLSIAQFSERQFLKKFTPRKPYLDQETMQRLVIDREPSEAEAAQSIHKYYMAAATTKKYYAAAFVSLTVLPLVIASQDFDAALIGLSVIASLIAVADKGLRFMKKLETGEWAIVTPPTQKQIETSQEKIRQRKNIALTPI